MKTTLMQPVKAIIFTFMLVIWLFKADAQESGLTENSNHAGRNFEKAFRINLTGFAGLNFEESIGGPFSINFEAGLGYPVISNTTKSNTGSLDITMQTLLNPYTRVEGRYYYNLEKRIFEGKQANKFAAEYISAFYKYQVYNWAEDHSETH